MTDYEDDQLKEENARKQCDMAQREIDDIRFVMSSEQGRRVVWSVLEKGRVVADGTHEELMASSPLYRELYNKQQMVAEEEGGAPC